MSNQTIYVTLSSLKSGTVPSVTESVSVNEGDNVTVNATWPSSASNTINCSLDFTSSGNQDPFNDVDGGVTSFNMTRKSSSGSATQTLLVENNAKVSTDTYDLILTIDGQTYTKDPKVVVSTKIPPT